MSTKPVTVRIAPKGVILILGIGAISTAALFIRFAQAERVPSLVIAAYRLTLASLLLLPLVLARHRAELRALPRRAWALALLSGLFLGLHFATWISSLAYTTVASAVVLVDTAPLFVALIAVLILRERITRPLLVGLLIALTGMAGVALVDLCTPNGCPALADWLRGPAMTGNLLALAGAVTLAVYLSLGRALRQSRETQRPLSLIVYIFITYSAAAVVLVISMLAAHQPIAGYSPRAYLWFVLLALVPQLLGHSIFNWALKYLPATYVSITELGEPISSTLLAIWLLGEIPSPLKWLGMGLILVGIGVASRAESA